MRLKGESDLEVKYCINRYLIPFSKILKLLSIILKFIPKFSFRMIPIQTYIWTNIQIFTYKNPQTTQTHHYISIYTQYNQLN